MTLGLHDRRARRRRQVWLGAMKWGLVLSALFAAGAYAYQTGLTLARRDVVRAEARIQELTDIAASLQTENDELRRSLAAARTEEAAWRQRYHQEVPTGEMQDLFARLRAKLEDGVSIERLRLVIDAARDARNCEPDPVSRRFIVTTPIYRGPNDSVTFANGRVTVTAMGASARNADGAPEGWFDPAEPVTMRITIIGGESAEATGVVPLHHSVIAGDWEHRFTAVAGPQGFLVVTADRCAYP